MELLTPTGALVSLAVILPLLALALVERRSAHVRRVLGLVAPGRASRVVPAAALVAFAVLVAVAAAQPAMTRHGQVAVRSDTEAFFVVDTSRSMLASAAPDAERRIERAREAAVRLREAIPDVPAGIVSLTDRALPHLYPTADRDVFEQTMRRVVEVEHPPPLAPGVRATTFDPLESFSGGGLFFSPRAATRLVVVLSDAETRDADPSLLASRIRNGAALQVVFVHVWADGERIFDERGRPEQAYRADPSSRGELDRLAKLLDARVVDVAALDDGAEAVRAAAGEGGAATRVEHVETFALAPYAVLLSFLPLGLLLWRRNVA